MSIGLREYARLAAERCQSQGWTRTWPEAGCYLHLEASEFIEALREKRGDPVKEAADVLFVLLSTCAAHGLSMDAIENQLAHLCLHAVKSYGKANEQGGE